jgi:hypothetical protein
MMTRKSTRLLAKATFVPHETSSAPMKKRKMSIESSISESSLSSLEDLGQEDVAAASTASILRKKPNRNDGEDDSYEPKSPRKKPASKPEPAYIIPEVVRKETTFNGRLGEFSIVV